MNARAILALGSLLLLVGFLRWRRDVEPEPWEEPYADWLFV